MVKKVVANLLQVAEKYRLVLWVLLLLLTATILKSPVHFTMEYHTVQAPYIFDNLFLFGVLYLLWIFLLLLLLFSRRDDKKAFDWENLTLVCIFGIVVIGFWAVKAPYGAYVDGIYNVAHVRYILENGHVGYGLGNLMYFDFPIIHVLAASIAQVTGLGVFETANIILLFNAALFSSFLYLLCAHFLKGTTIKYIAPFAALLMILGNTMVPRLMRVFYSHGFGFTIVAFFLVLLAKRDERFETAQDKLLMVILLIVAAINHLPTALLIVLVLAATYFLQKIGKQAKSISFVTVVVSLIFIFSWEFYGVYWWFSKVVKSIPRALEYLFQGGPLVYLELLAHANIGASLPLWANVTRLFWWIVIIGFGTILGLRNLLNIRKLGPMEKIETGGLIGSIVLGVGGMMATPSGLQVFRFLYYAPFFTIPILLGFLVTHTRKGLHLLVILFFIFSFPTFLSGVGTVSTDAIYPQEIAAGQFLESHVGGEEKMVISTSIVEVGSWNYFLPNADVGTESIEIYEHGIDAFWSEVDKLILLYSTATEDMHIFAYSPKFRIPARHILGIKVDDSRWEQYMTTVSTTDRIYDNGHEILFRRYVQ